MDSAPSPQNTAAGTDATHQRWPLRPWLSLMLLGCVVASLGLLVATERGASVAGTAVGRWVGLEPPAAESARTLKLLALERDGAWEIVDLGADAEVVEAAREAIAAEGLLSVEYTVIAEAPERSGWWAPTRMTTKFALRRTGGAGLPEAAAGAALEAVADLLQSRRAYEPMAEEVRSLAGTQTGYAGERERRLRKGYLHNAVAGFLAVMLGFSLSRRPGAIHEIYDATRSVVRKLGVAAALGFLWTAAPAILGIALLYFLGDIAAFLRTNTTYGWFGYVAVFIVSAGIGFLPTYGQSFLGGWVFGFRVGFPGAMLGFVGGSVIGYAIAQRVSRDKVMSLLESNPKARRVRNALVGRGFWKTLAIVTLIRVPPNSPFALTNLVLASAGVRLLPYVIGTAIGMAPRTGIAVWIAARGAATGARDIQDFVESQPWWAVPAGFAILLVVLAILGWIGNRALHEVTKDAGEPGPAAV